MSRGMTDKNPKGAKFPNIAFDIPVKVMNFLEQYPGNGDDTQKLRANPGAARRVDTLRVR